MGADPITLAGLLEAFAKQGGAKVSGNALTQGIITDGYLPTLGDAGNSWIALFKKIHDQYIPKLPLDGNVLFGEAVAYTFVQAMLKAGRNPTRGRPGQGDRGRPATGPGGGTVRLLGQRALRDDRGLHRCDQERGHSCSKARSLTTTTSPTSPITTYTGSAPAAPASGLP